MDVIIYSLAILGGISLTASIAMIIFGLFWGRKK